MRAVRAIRRGDRLAICHLCSYEVPLVVTDALRAFWLEQFTLDEIRVIGEAAWGPTHKWGDDWRDGFTFTATRIHGLSL